jgi:hypothetical protein
MTGSACKVYSRETIRVGSPHPGCPRGAFRACPEPVQSQRAAVL